MTSEAEAIRAGLRTLARGHHLSTSAAAAIFREIMSGACEPGQIGGLLMALAIKGETMGEISGAAEAMREASTRVLTTRARPIDVCGTGGSGVPRRNVSTATALVVAACGVAVAKHGNRAASSRSGSADVLEALGVDVEAPPQTVGRCIDELGVGFLFARTLHPAMRHAGPVRAALGVPTVFNLLGPLTNPARVRRQVLGVYDPARCHDLARALGTLGSERVFVVHGFRAGVTAAPRAPAGIDDLSPEGESLVVEWREGELHEHVLRRADAGLDEQVLADLAGGDPSDNAAALRRLLAGEPGAYRDAVIHAGALALVVAGDEPISTLGSAALRVAEAIDSGAAARVLEGLVETSRRRP
ncbi:Anthranilate phosphoribosyltransferase [Enhygromyxa salina]|uniref:Anthranilate phosphoribosyltransferase n=1 Tax=Enhygromyxa salina TaxID=215803 RepID=A0A2S9XGZ5_9BACT|nr:anthranilate phosphoribosyltransferase [Enhygromyxa salina]PRP92139.1 Anthranilate phosphoribosyltransferase [Enhygromyxa salina]